MKCLLKKNIIEGKDTLICNTIRENGSLENWVLTIVEEFEDCMDKTQADKRVEELRELHYLSFLPKKSADLPNFEANLPNFEANLPKKSADFIDFGQEDKKLAKKTCAFCSKVFSRRSHMLVHQEKSCKSKKPQEFVEKLEQQIEEQKAIITKLETQLTTVGGNNNNNNIQNSNNTQNIQNNNIIIEVGNENFSEFLTDKQKLKILEQKYTSLEFFIRNFHCNPKYPQFLSMKVPSLTKSHCEVFSEKHKKFIAKNINDSVEQLVDYRVGDIQSFLEDIPNVPEKTEKAVRDMVEKIETDTKYKRDKCTKIKMDIYNKFRKNNQES